MTSTVNDASDGDSVGAHRLTDDYPPAYTDFFGSSMPCIFKTGTAWEVRDGLEAQPFIREARPVYHPDKVEAWRAVGQAIWRSLDALAIEWTFVNPLAYANAGEPQPFCPFVVVVGVRPRTVPFARAVEAATAAAAMLHDAGFAGAEVAVVEGQTTHTVAHGPRLLSFDPVLDDIPDLRKAFTSTLGLSIAPLEFPHCGGTGALFYRLGGDDSDKRVALLTCAHVVRPHPGPGPESEHPNTATTNTTGSQPRDPEEIISPGSGAYDDALAALAEDIDSQARAIKAWDALLATLGDPAPDEPEPARVARRRTELLSSVRSAKERIEQAHALYDAVQDRADPGKRVVGSVLHCEPGELSSAGFTRDWALIELYEDMIDWDAFTGNQVFVAAASTTTSSQYDKTMWPQVADSDYPANGLLQARGIVEEAELRAPQHRDAHGQTCLLVLKNGAASGTTFGRANGLESFVRRCAQCSPDDSETTSLEIAVLRYSNGNGKEHPAFSEPGDSGSVVLDRTGKIVGVLTGGAGFGFGMDSADTDTDVSYMIPYFDIHAQLTAKFPGIELYPAVERAPLY